MRDIAALLWRQRAGGFTDAERASEVQARRLAADLERLGPTFIKLGQVLSTRPDLMAPPYIQALSHLQDQVGPFDVTLLVAILENELGMRLRDAFVAFEEKPLAAASLGQVHRAVTRSGVHVAVKVQRPGIRERIEEDVGAFDAVAAMLDKHTRAGRTYEFSMMLAEFKVSLARELDYESEARNLEWLRRSLADFPTIVVPLPLHDYTTSRVLTMEFLKGTKITDVPPERLASVDGRMLADEVFRAYLKQIFVDGMFHADPHPGNVLLTDDNKVALIDLGMVAYLAPVWRDGLFRLLLSLAEGRSDEVADVCVELGEPRDDFDERLFRKAVAQIVAQQQNMTVADLEVGTLVLKITKAATTSGMRVPSELTMLGKMLLNLDQVGRTLAPDFRPNDAVQRHASALMQARIRQQLSSAHLYEKALEVNDFVQRMPSRLNRMLEDLSHGRFKARVDVIDEKIIVDGMQKVANRISAGLILAALIIGSTMMMRVDTDFRILGYPGFAMLFFLAAALGGVMLVLDVLFKDESVKRKKRKVRTLDATTSSRPLRVRKPRFFSKR